MRADEVGLEWNVGESEGQVSFDDFGPRSPLSGPRPASLDGDGVLVVEVAGRVAGKRAATKNASLCRRSAQAWHHGVSRSPSSE